MANKTRKERARVLRQRLERGPCLAPSIERIAYSREQAEADCRRWLESWILPEVLALVPELAAPKVKP